MHQLVAAALAAAMGAATAAAALPPAGAQYHSAAPTMPIVLPEPPAPEVVTGAADRANRMTVPVRIAGEGPFRFMVDTGSQATVVTPELRDRLKLETLGRATVIGMAATLPVDVVRVNELEFANRTMAPLHAPLLEGRHIGADGILGLDSLQDLRVMIDFRGNRIAVADAADTRANSGYEIVVRARRKLGRLIITDAIVDGVRTALVLDTGAQGSVGNMALAQRLRTREGSERTAYDVTGAAVTGRSIVARRIAIGRGTGKPITLTGVNMVFAPSPAFIALGLVDKPALVLGIDDLRVFDRVAIDFARRTVLFDLPEDAIRRPFAAPAGA